jgi:ribonuclease VapC
MPAAEVDAMLHPLPVEIVPADQGLAHIVGRLRAVTASAGLSLGDRFCLALAKRDGLPAMTADKQWRTVAEAVEAKIHLIR